MWHVSRALIILTNLCKISRGIYREIYISLYEIYTKLYKDIKLLSKFQEFSLQYLGNINVMI